MADGDLTREQVERALPTKLKSSATQSLTDKINNSVSDPLIAEQIRDNFVTYTSILQEGKYKTEDYLNAVSYVTFKLMNLSNLEAYQHTFPKRYQTLVAKGTSSSQIASYVASYHRGKLVNTIMEQSLIPTWIVNQETYQKAINVQADLMLTANSEKVRSDAANSLLTHLKKPEDNKAEIKIDIALNDGMATLEASLTELAEKQLLELEADPNVSVQDIADRKMKSIN